MKRIFTILSFTICTTLIFAQPLVSTWVGTGAPGVISAGVHRLSAGLDMPYGVAIDSRGNLWLSEEGGNGYGFIIKMVRPDDTVRVRAGGVSEDCFKNGASTAARFSQPRGLAVDASDNIYVADFGNSVIRKISKFMNVGSSQWVSVYAGKWDSTSACYIPHPGYADGTLKTAQFNGPSDIAFDKTKDTMYVADAMNNCIRKIVNGQVTTVAGKHDSAGFRDGTTANAKFNSPTGVFVAANGDIYVADHMNSRVRKISGGIVSTVVSNIWTPDDVWVMANGDIYISDQHRIRKYAIATSTLSTFAGSSMPNDTGNIDGLGTDARFDNVKCLIADNSNSGLFFVADQSNHKIRKVVTCASYKPLITITGGQQKNDSTFSTCTGDTIYLEVKTTYPSYKWSSGETTSKIFTTSTKIISCTVINSDGCQGNSDNYYINISDLKPKITLNGPATFCPGDSVLLLGDNSYDWYKWTKGGATFKEGIEAVARSIYVSDKNLGKYQLSLILGACVGTSAELTIATSTQIVPTINITKGDSNLCTNDTLILESSTTYTTYTWKKDGTAIQDATSKSVSITTAGNYTLDVTKAGGCNGTSYPMHVVIIPAPPTPTFTVSHDTLWSSVADAYQWFFNNQKIIGATTRGYIAKQSGSYSVEIIDTSNGCRARSVPQVVTLSILELSGGLRFDVYPNPTTGKLTVSGTIKSSGEFNIRVIDLLGKSVINNILNLNPGKFEKQIDLQGNPSGIYFVIISSNGNQGMMKLILR